MRPTGTYRVQVRPDFPLKATAELADYLADLGVSHLYTAPLLTATPGSQHGYDVVDHPRSTRRSAARRAGGAGRRRCDAAGLGLVMDIVPEPCRRRGGLGQPDLVGRAEERAGTRAYAKLYDIDWSRGRLLMPVLADEPDALAELKVEDGELHYYDKRYPIADGTGEGTPRRCTTGSTTSWSTGPAATAS